MYLQVHRTGYNDDRDKSAPLVDDVLLHMLEATSFSRKRQLESKTDSVSPYVTSLFRFVY